MTYKEKFVAVVKQNGRVLREHGDEVRLPFGSEYEISMKNLNSRTAVVKVNVDGQDVLDGNELVMYPNQQMDLKGFLKGRRAKNRFRFIKKTKEISDYRGDRLDDGIIRVEFRFEKERDYFIYTSPTGTISKRGAPVWTYDWDCSYNSYKSGVTYSFCCSDQTLSNNNSLPKADEGITVKGSETNQKFNYTDVGALEPYSEVIVLRLVGTTSRGRNIRKPITTKTKITCPTCGRRWKSSMKYCGNCSTYLG